jgi:hypothetical protein
MVSGNAYRHACLSYRCNNDKDNTGTATTEVYNFTLANNDDDFMPSPPPRFHPPSPEVLLIKK